MKKLLIGICIGVALILVSCGTTARQAKQESAGVESAFKTVKLSPEMSRKYDYFFLEALKMKQKGEYDAAFELYNHCLDINPQGAAALYELSQFYMFLKFPQLGERMQKEAVRADQSNFWYKQTLAAYYQSKNMLPEAISVYEDMTEQFPTKLEPLLALSDLYGRVQNYEQVIHTLNRLEELDGKSEPLSLQKFQVYLTMNKEEEAFSEMENLSKEYPYDMRYRTALGDLYLNNNKTDRAYAIYQEVLKLEPSYAPAMMSLANYYQKVGQDSLYHEQLDRLLLNDQVESKTKLDIFRQLIMQSEQTDRDSLKILSLFKEVLQRPQPNADVPMLCAQYLITKNMDKDAKPVLWQVLDIDPENTPARLQLLSYAIRENNLDEVIKIALPAMEFTPEVLEFYYYAGLAYYQQEKTDEALNVFSKGVRQINEKSDKDIASDFYAIMGDLYHMKDMNEQAYAAYDSSLVYKPDNIGTLNNYAYFLSVDKKHLDKAEEMSYKAVKAEPKNETYLDTYAWILFQKGKYTEARIYIDEAMKNGGEKSSVVIEHCGDIYYMLGEKQKALEYWKKAESVKEDPADGSTPRTEEELKRLKQKIKLKKYIEE